MLKLLIFYTRTSAPIARAIFSGTRTDATIDYVRRITSVRKLSISKKKDLDEVFEQLKAISLVRNLVVHYESSGDVSDKIVSDLPRSLSPEKARIRRVSPDVLKAMTFDLYKIANRLNFHRWHRKHPWSKKLSSHTRYVLTAAWQYKPPQGHPPKPKKSGH